MKEAGDHIRGIGDFGQGFDVVANEPMSRHTSFRIGGPADLFARPRSVEELRQLVLRADSLAVPVTVVGGGTNLLVLDRGIRGLVISTVRLTGEVSLEPAGGSPVRVRVPAGNSLAALARRVMDEGYSGFGFAAGIPGTVGGAVVMNAGTGKGTIADFLVFLEILEPGGAMVRVDREDLTFGVRSLAYRGRPVQGSGLPVVTAAAFQVERADRELLLREWDELMEKRRRSQPSAQASAGCFFRNPENNRPAGYLIDRAGLKGTRVGRAMVSDVHANFIVNLGGATAAEVLELKALVEKRVREGFGVELSAEVRIEGD